MARTKQRTVNWTNKQLQQMHLDLLLNTVYEIGSAEAAHEWLMPHYSAASPYCAFFPPLNHMMNALEIIEEGDYDGMPSFDKKLALKIQQSHCARHQCGGSQSNGRRKRNQWIDSR